MKLIINGDSLEVRARTLAALLTELNYQGNWLATARNGEVVSARDRTTCALVDDDRIEILSPMKGG